eukprot:TRINITY_DN3225_c0_g3_i1.p1 TRINITY_DN3225_c0_g3~~TRINITY_DN3225_c0_g3_i1.p1  ORF type:complete len:281 (-),score=71.34 TRINITY_DN3225_c0_g3_i1:77-919(-)
MSVPEEPSGAVKRLLTIEESASLIHSLLLPDERPRALKELSERRELIPDLGHMLWYSPGVFTVLLEEVLMVFPMLEPTNLSPAASNRVCSALALIQQIAAVPSILPSLIHAQIPLYLYPCLNTSNLTRPFQLLRMNCLGVIGALLQSGEEDVAAFLVRTDGISLFLKNIETGLNLSQALVALILRKILSFEVAINFVKEKEFPALPEVLKDAMMKTDQPELIKNGIVIFFLLARRPRLREALMPYIPPIMRDGSLAGSLDPRTREVLANFQQMCFGQSFV